MPHRHATILLTVSQGRAEREVILPNDTTARSVEGEHPRVRSGKIDDAVDNDRSGLQPVLIIAGLENPCRPKRFHIRSVDLVECAIAQSGVSAAVARPVFLGG